MNKSLTYDHQMRFEKVMMVTNCISILDLKELIDYDQANGHMLYQPIVELMANSPCEESIRINIRFYWRNVLLYHRKEKLV
jgi:hypothetical protein